MKIILQVGLTISLISFAISGTAQRHRYTVTENKANNEIDIKIDGKLFTAYLYSDRLMKPVLFPIITANDDTITRGWPLAPRPLDHVDHPHHIGLWFNYESVNGLDFWNNSSAIAPEKKSHYGRIRHVHVDKITTGKDGAALEVSAFWENAAGKRLLKQQTKYVFAQLKNMRTIEMSVKLTALDKEVDFKDTKDGLIAIRMRTELEQPSTVREKYIDSSGNIASNKQTNQAVATGLYRSSAGVKGDAVWGSRAKWVALDGRLRNNDVSVVILDHPANIGYPTYWHARGYGLFAANPLGQKVFSKGKEALNLTLKPGASTQFKYKVLITSPKHLTDQQIKRAAQKFWNTKSF